MLHTATNGMIGVVSHRTQAKVGGSTQDPGLHAAIIALHHASLLTNVMPCQHPLSTSLQLGLGLRIDGTRQIYTLAAACAGFCALLLIYNMTSDKAGRWQWSHEWQWPARFAFISCAASILTALVAESLLLNPHSYMHAVARISCQCSCVVTGERSTWV